MSTASASNGVGVGVSDNPYEYCDICRLNHTDSKTHVYTKRHRSSLDKVLSKLKSKIDEVKIVIQSPVIKESSFEKNVMVWCYCCEKELRKHKHEEGVTVCWSGFASHLNSVEHLKKTKAFWWKNRVNSSLLNNYLILEEDYQRFIKNVSRAKDEFQKLQDDNHTRNVELILAMEARRKEFVDTCCSSEMVAPSSRSTNSAAVNMGSSSISSQASNGEHNIFTGMQPPWLQDDKLTKTTTEIRPNMEDFLKHLKLIKKSKLPPNRVGANFDRETPRPENWLPSFGRVWNNSRRQSSKQQYEREPRWQRNRQRPKVTQNVPAFPSSEPITRPPPNLNKYIL